MKNKFLHDNSIKWISTSKSSDAILNFKKEFSANSNIKNSQLFIAGYGFYQAYINGNPVDEYYFKPNVTDYKKRRDPKLNVSNTYFSFFDQIDVTKLLKDGSNELSIDVASGYFHNDDKLDAPNYVYGKRRVKYLLVITYENGEETYVYSDSDTLVAVTKNVSTLFLGDVIHFDNNSCNYSPSIILEDELNLVPNPIKNDKVHEIFKGNVILDKPNHKIIDFGINHSGNIDCLIKGKLKQKVNIKYSEFKNPDGSLNFFSGAYADVTEKKKWESDEIKRLHMVPVIQQNNYFLSGNKDHIGTYFSWKTYRYVDISSDEPFELEDIKSLFIYNDIESVSTFECSNPIFNKIYEAYMQTQKCNLHAGLMTDCPHREKSQYAGDGQVVSKSLLRNFDSVPFLSKFLDDVIASQNANGYIPNTIPDFAGGGGNFWGYAIVKLPWVLYQYTGDVKYYEKAYSAIYKWIVYLLKNRDSRGVISSHGNMWFLGDWLAPKEVVSDSEYVNSICLVLAMDKFIKISETLHRTVDPNLLMVFSQVKQCINNVYYHKENYSYSKNVQGETMLAVYSKIVPQQDFENVTITFLDSYTKNDAHIDTGFILTPMLFDTLARHNYFEIAYNLLNKTDYPSYYLMLKDESTFPEHWSKKWLPYKKNDDEVVKEPVEDTSHCHPMYGAIVDWIEEYVGGISLKNLYKKEIKISPKYVEQVKHCKSSYKDIYFQYELSDGLNMNLNVSEGIKAIVDIPGYTRKEFIVIDKKTNGESVKNLPFELDSGEYLIKEKL